MSEPYLFHPGTNAVLVSIPHAGTVVPDDLRDALTEEALRLPDTDWHVDRLYDWVRGLGCSLLVATHSRYVVDLNRPPDDTPLYSGATTGLCPSVQFDGTPLYRSGHVPDAGACRERVAQFWQPYHARLRSALRALRERHGHAVLFDAHSIRSEVPRLFDGRLPDLNVGTNDGRSAAPELQERVLRACESGTSYRTVLNGRFKGGYITRHYGDPERRVHAVQLELAQRNYMEEDHPYRYREDRVAALRTVLQDVVAELIAWSRAVVRRDA